MDAENGGVEGNKRRWGGWIGMGLVGIGWGVCGEGSVRGKTYY